MQKKENQSEVHAFLGKFLGAKKGLTDYVYYWCSGLSTGHEKHDGRFAQKACVTSDDIFMWCHKLSLPIQKRSIFYHLGIQSCLSAFGGSLTSTQANYNQIGMYSTLTLSQNKTKKPFSRTYAIR